MTEHKQNKAMTILGYFSLLCTLMSFGSAILVNSAYGSEWRANQLICSFESCELASPDTQNPGSPSLILVQAPLNHENIANIGRWRLVRTPGPEKSGEVVSIMHTADVLQSDLDFAGLLIRCREKSSLQIAFVVIRPFPPRTHPQITINTGHTSVRVQASVVPPGSLLSLPDEAEVLARGPWQSASQLTVDIEGDGAKIHGIVSLENLSRAIAVLQANCIAQ